MNAQTERNDSVISELFIILFIILIFETGTWPKTFMAIGCKRNDTSTEAVNFYCNAGGYIYGGGERGVYPFNEQNPGLGNRVILLLSRNFDFLLADGLTTFRITGICQQRYFP